MDAISNKLTSHLSEIWVFFLQYFLTQLAVISLGLFYTLLDLNCEDIMYSLVLKWVMFEQKKDTYAENTVNPTLLRHLILCNLDEDHSNSTFDKTHSYPWLVLPWRKQAHKTTDTEIPILENSRSFQSAQACQLYPTRLTSSPVQILPTSPPRHFQGRVNPFDPWERHTPFTIQSMPNNREHSTVRPTPTHRLFVICAGISFHVPTS